MSGAGAGGLGALIAAAGSGERLGRGPKAFLEVGGSTLLDLCLEALAGEVEEVVVALPPDARWRPQRWAEVFADIRTITGGSDRQASVRALVAASESETVIVHDVARPFLTPLEIRRVAVAAREMGAASAAVTVADTLVDALTGATVERDAVRAVQTPQAFARQLLLAAHQAAAAGGYSATDDAALVRRLGHAVRLVDGSRLLAKLTEPGDLVWAEAVVGVWRAQLAAARGGAS